MAKIILNREEVEDAVRAYVKDKFMSYNDKTQINVTQERKVSCVVTFGEKEHRERTTALPGLGDDEQNNEGDLVDNSGHIPGIPDNDDEDLDMNMQPERETPPNPMPHDKVEGPFPG